MAPRHWWETVLFLAVAGCAGGAGTVDAGGSQDGQDSDGDGGCVEQVCGNGFTEDPEQCDDGANGDDDDGCRDDCTLTCRDAALDCQDAPGDCLRPACSPNEAGRVCADEPEHGDIPADADACHTGTCEAGVPVQTSRGDGTACDNGSGEAGDYCREGICGEPVCGDEVRGPLEECDDGNREAGDGCSPDCEFETCGNGAPEGSEQCDDGRNGDDEDGCRDDCRFSCQDPVADCAGAQGDCRGAVCVPAGPGQVCEEAIDILDVPDDGKPCSQGRCDPDGTPATDPLADGWACDNGADPPDDYCAAGVCIDPLCGDAIEGPQEDCDDGNFDVCDGCLPTCMLHQNTCGDHFTCPPESCDDGNEITGDGCADCVREAGVCPPEMVSMPADPALGVIQPYCMDRWEASRPDAAVDAMGDDVTRAASRPGVLPWQANPVSSEIFQQFQVACTSAGKRICTKEEFFAACTGPDRRTYVFGDVFGPEACNCVDTFCDDYCQENDIDPCNTDANCGYVYYCFHLTPTGSFPGCTNALGTLDLNGNVWELVPSETDLRGYEVRGGAFNCGGAAARLACDFNAGWTALYAGFRCCLDQ